MRASSKRKRKETAGLLGANILLIVICFLVLVPVLYAVSVSLNVENSLLSSDFSFIPKKFTLDNYRAVFFDEPVLRWLKNSLILAVTTVLFLLEQEFRLLMYFPEKIFREEN